MFLATQVLPVCVSCSHCLFLIVTVLCLLTSWACWPTLGKVDKGSKHWTKQSPAFSLCSFSLALSPSLPPHFSLTVYCALLPSLLSLWRCVHQHLEKQSCSLTAWAHSPPHLPPSSRALSLSLSLSGSVCVLAVVEVRSHTEEMLAADCGANSQRGASAWTYYQAYQGHHGSIFLYFFSSSSLIPLLKWISESFSETWLLKRLTDH